MESTVNSHNSINQNSPQPEFQLSSVGSVDFCTHFYVSVQIQTSFCLVSFPCMVRLKTAT